LLDVCCSHMMWFGGKTQTPLKLKASDSHDVIKVHGACEGAGPITSHACTRDTRAKLTRDKQGVGFGTASYNRVRPLPRIPSADQASRVGLGIFICYLIRWDDVDRVGYWAAKINLWGCDAPEQNFFICLDSSSFASHQKILDLIIHSRKYRLFTVILLLLPRSFEFRN
jgi:hypothetical protein